MPVVDAVVVVAGGGGGAMPVVVVAGGGGGGAVVAGEAGLNHTFVKMLQVATEFIHLKTTWYSPPTVRATAEYR